MPESLRATMRRNNQAMREFTRQAGQAEAALERVATRAGQIGEELGAGLRRAVESIPGQSVSEGGGGGGGGASVPRGSVVLFDAGGNPILRGGAPPVSGGGGRGGSGGGGHGGFQRVGEEAAGAVPGSAGARLLSGGTGGGSGAGGGSFDRVEAAARGTSQAVRTLDTRSVPLLSSIDAGIRRLGDRIDRLSDLGVLSRAD